MPFGLRDEHRIGLGDGTARQRAHPSVAGLVLGMPVNGHPERVNSSPLESVPQQGGCSRKSFNTPPHTPPHLQSLSHFPSDVLSCCNIM